MRLTVCPFSLGVFLGTAAWVTLAMRRQSTTKSSSEEPPLDESPAVNNKTTPRPVEVHVVFVLGGPGAGKGTQCALITQRCGYYPPNSTVADAHHPPVWVHLSAGDLLRAERQRPGSLLGEMINACIAAGQLVPSHITCQLLQQAMLDSIILQQRNSPPPTTTNNNSPNTIMMTTTTTTAHFLIDGFPRSYENAQAWEQCTVLSSAPHWVTAVHMDAVLNLTCPEEVLLGRLWQRGQTSGRVDDQPDVIRQRLQTFVRETAPMIEYYQNKGQLMNIQADQPVESVYRQVQRVLERFSPPQAVFLDTTTTTTTS